MSETLPPDVQQFVRQAIANGEYATEQELFTEAVRVLREVTERHQALRADIQLAIDALDRGEGQPLDMADIKAQVARNYQARRNA
jgi:putative addiction module CopG family antidote